MYFTFKCTVYCRFFSPQNTLNLGKDILVSELTEYFHLFFFNAKKGRNGVIVYGLKLTNRPDMVAFIYIILALQSPRQEYYKFMTQSGISSKFQDSPDLIMRSCLKTRSYKLFCSYDDCINWFQF